MISTTIGTAMYRTILTSLDNGEESPGETTHAAQFSHSWQIEWRQNNDYRSENAIMFVRGISDIFLLSKKSETN